MQASDLSQVSEGGRIVEHLQFDARTVNDLWRITALVYRHRRPLEFLYLGN